MVITTDSGPGEVHRKPTVSRQALQAQEICVQTLALRCIFMFHKFHFNVCPVFVLFRYFQYFLQSDLLCMLLIAAATVVDIQNNSYYKLHKSDYSHFCVVVLLEETCIAQQIHCALGGCCTSGRMQPRRKRKRLVSCRPTQRSAERRNEENGNMHVGVVHMTNGRSRWAGKVIRG